MLNFLKLFKLKKENKDVLSNEFYYFNSELELCNKFLQFKKPKVILKYILFNFFL